MLRSLVVLAFLAAGLAAGLPLGPSGALAQPAAPAAGPVFHERRNPRSLDDWGVVYREGDRLALAGGVVPYDLNTPLFTDYAHKLRTIWVPEAAGAAPYREGEVFEFPVGTIISKTFYYPGVPGDDLMSGAVARRDKAPGDFAGEGLDLTRVRLIETRLLVHRANGWVALPYVWNEAQTAARLQRTGALLDLELVDAEGEREAFTYMVPNSNQCAGCHATNNTTRKIWPIGPKARHLNKDYPYADGTLNQLVRLSEAGYLTGAPDPAHAPRNAAWADPAASLNDRARAYLDANCTHCHNPVGPADTSGLHLSPDTPEGPLLGRCKAPIAAGSGTGGRRYGIVPGAPDDSIFVFRVETTAPDKMMPELGRATAHREGAALIRAWIEGMEGGCGT